MVVPTVSSVSHPPRRKEVRLSELSGGVGGQLVGVMAVKPKELTINKKPDRVRAWESYIDAGLLAGLADVHPDNSRVGMEVFELPITGELPELTDADKDRLRELYRIAGWRSMTFVNVRHSVHSVAVLHQSVVLGRRTEG